MTVRIKEIKQQNLKTREWEYLYQNFTANTTQITNRGFNQDQIEQGNNAWVQIVGDNYLQIGHQLNSDLTSSLMDVTPYYYTIVLSLPTDIDPTGEYSKTVTFVQWPEVYVVADPNSNNGAGVSTGIFVNGTTGAQHTGTHYYVGDYQTWYGGSSTTICLGSSAGLSGNSGNVNPNMYVLTVSVSNTYTIADPRTKEVSMPEFRYREVSRSGYWTYTYTYGDWVDNWAQGRWTEDASVTNHVLTSSENTSSTIAPKVRIASSYGSCYYGNQNSSTDGYTGRTQQEAILRCASYQEDGIPAGRWRLPTMAEVQFISTLSALGRIPYLFGSSSSQGTVAVDSDDYYWTANGLILINNGKGISRPPQTGDPNPFDRSVRCVYDEWFWGDASETRPAAKTTFTWGDRNY